MNFDSLKALFYRPEFFRKQEFHSGEALRFYTFTILVFSLATVVLLIPGVLMLYQDVTSGTWAKQQSIINNIYPEGLVVNIREGEVSTNSQGAVFFPVPAEWQGRDISADNLLVINTEKPIQTTDFAEANTLAILGKNEIGFRDPEKSEIRIMSLRGDAREPLTFTLTDQVFTTFVDQAFRVIQAVIAIGFLLSPLFIFIGLWMGYLVYSLLGALLVWIAASIRGHKLSYDRAYLSALYLLPIPFLASFVLTLSGIHRFPLLFSLVLFFAAFINFQKVKVLAKPTPTVSENSTDL